MGEKQPQQQQQIQRMNGTTRDKELQYKLDFQQFVNARISFSIFLAALGVHSEERYQGILNISIIRIGRWTGKSC